MRKIKAALVLTLGLCALQTLFAETIAEIQGEWHTSPYNGKAVSGVEGVITAIYGTKYNAGFYMQSVKADKNPATSEGIWVECKDGGRFAVGDLVSVSGIVMEIQFGKPNPAELTITSIQAEDIKAISRGNEVKAVRIDPKKIPQKIHTGKTTDKLNIAKNAMDFYESMEGMLVKIEKPVITGVAESHGEIAVLTQNGAFAKDRTNNGGVLYSYDNEQTQKIIVGDEFVSLRKGKAFKDSAFTPNPGDAFDGDITGIFTFTYSNYKIFNTAPLPPLVEGATKRDANRLTYSAKSLSIASYNIENFTIADGTERVKILATQVKDDLKLPDIIGLVEVGDDDGGAKKTDELSAEKTLTAIVDEIKSASGVEYKYMTVAPQNGKDGGWPEMHIRNAVLYRADRLSPPYTAQGDAVTDTEIKNGRLTFNPGRIGNKEKIFNHVRKPLVAHLQFIDGKKDVFVIVNHLKSKRADDKLYSANQPVKRKSEDVRIPEGKYISDFLKKLNGTFPDAVLLTMGDMNDFEFSLTMQAMKGDLMVSAVETLPPNERHTYVYQGNSQVLDNLLVNKRYAKNLQADILNINSEFTKAQGYFSDHDPICAVIELE
ncbi:MAG: hypothetical protein ACTTKL_07170 [Treponema sp.]